MPVFQQLARLEEAQSRCRILHAEGETLRLRLDGREKRIEGSTQMQNGTIDDLHQQNGLLSKQLNQRTLTIQQLTVGSKQTCFSALLTFILNLYHH